MPDGAHCRINTQLLHNDTHQSTSDPEAKLYRRTHHGEARLSYLGHVLVENRHGLVVDVMATQADGTAERDAGSDASKEYQDYALDLPLSTLDAGAYVVAVDLESGRERLRHSAGFQVN